MEARGALKRGAESRKGKSAAFEQNGFALWKGVESGGRKAESGGGKSAAFEQNSFALWKGAEGWRGRRKNLWDCTILIKFVAVNFIFFELLRNDMELRKF